MSPFLRWGVFSILAVAAMVYAYNASKDLAARRASAAPAPSVADAVDPAEAALSAPCEIELAVARRAREARASGDPLDRLLRIREIAFEEDDVRRQRLSSVAQRWYDYPGPIDATTLRDKVAADCTDATPP